MKHSCDLTVSVCLGLITWAGSSGVSYHCPFFSRSACQRASARLFFLLLSKLDNVDCTLCDGVCAFPSGDFSRRTSLFNSRFRIGETWGSSDYMWSIEYGHFKMEALRGKVGFATPVFSCQDDCQFSDSLFKLLASQMDME